MNDKYKVIFDFDRVSLNTVKLFSEVTGPGDTFHQMLALSGLIEDCLWDTSINAYTNDKKCVTEFMESLKLHELNGLTVNLASQIDLMNQFNAAINEGKTYG